MEIVESVTEDVSTFYEEIKEDQELSSLMAKSAWKNIGLKSNPGEIFSKVKNQKILVTDCLLLVSTYAK